MKNRWRAFLLAVGLSASVLATGVYAHESTEAAVQTETPDASLEAQEASEAAEEIDEAQNASGGLFAGYYDQLKEAVVQTLQVLSSMSDEQLDALIDSGQDSPEVAMAAKWKNVKDELGNFVEVTEQEVSEENQVITITSKAVYDGVNDKTSVTVDYVYDVRNSTISMDWNVKYPMSKLLTQAALNTVMGIGIVFLVLLFLSFVIEQMHWIPDMIEKKNKSKQVPRPAAPAAVSAPAAVLPEENLTDDLELVAVITAAIAASENAPADGFVVRTIRKANKRNWQNAL